MTFKETLAVLHGWIGLELEVAVRTSHGMTIANIAGPLAVGSDLSARGHYGPFFFQLDAVRSTGFFIGEREFRTAWWVDKERTLLGVSVGDVQFLIESK